MNTHVQNIYTLHIYTYLFIRHHLRAQAANHLSVRVALRLQSFLVCGKLSFDAVQNRRLLCQCNGLVVDASAIGGFQLAPEIR
jgi:hypothetical protein